MDPFRMLFNTASAEKEAMMSLNERLGDLFCRLDKAKSEGGGGGCVVYMKAIECLQEEIRLLKACYDSELSKLRSAVVCALHHCQECVINTLG